MTKKSHARLMRDAWTKENLKKLMEIAEVSPEEKKEIEDKMEEFKIK